MYLMMMFLTALQYSAGDVQVNDTFTNTLVVPRLLQAEENGHPVPLCDEKGKCVCPEGFELQMLQDEASRAVEKLTCKPHDGMLEGKRAKQTDYPTLPRPSTYGK